MFLAIAEIRHSKLRYILILMTIALIGYLTLILTALAYGLAQSNRSAVDSWHASTIVLNKDADDDLRQSSLTQQQVRAVRTSTGTSAALGELSVSTTTASGGEKTTVEMLGIDKDQFIYQQLQPSQGRRFATSHEALAGDGLKAQGYAVGDVIVVAGGQKFIITGFVHNAALSVAPVIYVPLQSWRQLKYGSSTPARSMPAASAVVERGTTAHSAPQGTERLNIATFINKLPGYSAQNITFTMMIGFLFVITLVIIAIFQYILTMQKIPNYMVLKIQGIPTWFLVRSMLFQALLIAVIGVAIAAALTALSAAFIPASVPMSFDMELLGAAGLAIVIMSILGSLASVRTITTIRPTSVVAGE